MRLEHFLSPLWGGTKGGGREASQNMHEPELREHQTPTPSPPHKGEGKRCHGQRKMYPQRKPIKH
jgi:hypothetical protein